MSLLALGCTGASDLPFKGPSESHVVDGVPFFPQERYQCGPASLAGVMQYHGKRVTPEEVARAIYRPDLHGSVSLDLVLYARSKKLKAKWYRGSPQNLVIHINAGYPLVVMLDRGIGPVRNLHYMVIVGYSPLVVIANSGLQEHKSIPWNQFLSNWKRTKFWTLLISSHNR